jgi:hypothetical protein
LGNDDSRKIREGCYQLLTLHKIILVLPRWQTHEKTYMKKMIIINCILENKMGIESLYKYLLEELSSKQKDLKE